MLLNKILKNTISLFYRPLFSEKNNEKWPLKAKQNCLSQLCRADIFPVDSQEQSWSWSIYGGKTSVDPQNDEGIVFYLKK